MLALWWSRYNRAMNSGASRNGSSLVRYAFIVHMVAVFALYLLLFFFSLVRQDPILERMRSILESRYGSATNSARKMKQLFAEMDINGDGRLTHGEFKQALSGLKVSLPLIVKV